MFLFWRSSADKKLPPPPPVPPESIDKRAEKSLRTFAEGLREAPPEIVVAAVLLGALGMKCCSLFHARYVQRYPNINWMTPNLYSGKHWIRGRVVAVNDPDNFRLYHLPSVNIFGTTPKTKAELKLRENTIPIRMVGIDAPEIPHFGKPGQPFGQEALDWLKTAIMGKIVYCQILDRDFHSRVVAVPVLPLSQLWFMRVLGPRFGKNVSKELLKAGYAITYEQKGAVYGDETVEAYKILEDAAQHQRKGMWINGTKIETPTEYKKRHRSDSNATMAQEEIDLERQSTLREKKRRRGLTRGWIPWL